MKALLNNIVLKVLKRLGYKTVHFIHIGKTGGSAIRGTFSEASKLNKRQLVSKPYLFIMNGHGFTFADAGENDFVFFVVRDPLSRFVSSFYSRMREGKPKNYNPWSPEEKIAFENFETPNELAEALTSENPDLKNAAIHAMEGINHVKNHYWDWFGSEDELRRKSSNILGVLRLENLTDDFEQFRKKHKISVGSLPSDPVKKHKNPDSFDKKLSDIAKTNLKNWYATDYHFMEVLKELGLLKS